MRHKNLFLIFLIISSLLFSGCITVNEDEGEVFIAKPVDVSLISNYTGIDIDNIVTGVRIPPIPTRKSVPGFSYLESYSMIIAYLDESINTSDVFATAGLGMPTTCDTSLQNLRPMQGNVAYTQIRSMKNYKLRWIVGYAEKSAPSQYVTDPYLEEAYGKIVYSTQDNASLKFLKAVLGTGRPVQVRLDLYYLENYNLKYQNQPQYIYHYAIVTGYNETYIYVSETYNSEDNVTEFKDMSIPIDKFMDAWSLDGDNYEDTEVKPYWMLFFEEKKGDKISKPSFSEIISTQKNLSKNIETDFDTYISKVNTGEYDVSDTNWDELASVKQLFAEYLRKNTQNDTADAYETLYQDYHYCQENPNNIKQKLSEIKNHELTANLLIN